VLTAQRARERLEQRDAVWFASTAPQGREWMSPSRTLF
jgi:hypothetical protein